MWDFLTKVFGVLILKSCFCDFASAWAWACIIFMNIFVNLVKKSLVEKGTRDKVGVSRRIRALEGVKILLLPM